MIIDQNKSILQDNWIRVSAFWFVAKYRGVSKQIILIQMGNNEREKYIKEKKVLKKVKNAHKGFLFSFNWMETQKLQAKKQKVD